MKNSLNVVVTLIIIIKPVFKTNKISVSVARKTNEIISYISDIANISHSFAEDPFVLLLLLFFVYVY